MLKEGISPSIITYSSLINGFCKQSDVEEAMKLLNEMKASNVDQTIATFSKLVEGCIQHGDVKKMSKLHNMMHMACPSAGITSHKQMELSELSNAKEMLDSYTISEAAC
jgi:leucine-rich PPR motif-containing protein